MLPFVEIALNMVKVPILVQMKLTAYRLKIALGAFQKFQNFSKISIWPSHTKAFDHRAKVTEKKNIFVVLSKQKTDYIVEKSSKN